MFRIKELNPMSAALYSTNSINTSGTTRNIARSIASGSWLQIYWNCYMTQALQSFVDYYPQQYTTATVYFDWNHLQQIELTKSHGDRD